MGDRAKRCIIEVIQLIDGSNRVADWYIRRLTVMAANPLTEQPEIEKLIAAFTQLQLDSLITRFRIIRKFHADHPGFPIDETEIETDRGVRAMLTQPNRPNLR